VKRGCLLVLLGLAACGRVSPSAIERWRSAPDGPDRLAAAVIDQSVDPGLRASAGAALVEIGAYARLQTAVATLDAHQRTRVVPLLVPLLGKLLDATDPERAGDAREVLYALRIDAPDARPHIDAVLLPALEADLRAGRTMARRQRVKDLVIGLGPVVVPRMVALLEDPAVPFATPVEAVFKVGDRRARHEGGAALVRRAQAARPVPEALWAALAILGGDAAVTYLEAAAAQGTEGAMAALARMPGRAATPPAPRDARAAEQPRAAVPDETRLR
jgi:hypothetical protein